MMSFFEAQSTENRMTRWSGNFYEIEINKNNAINRN